MFSFFTRTCFYDERLKVVEPPRWWTYLGMMQCVSEAAAPSVDFRYESYKFQPTLVNCAFE